MDIYGKYDRLLWGLIWGSKQEAQMWKKMAPDHPYFPKTARPHVLQGFSSVPPAFSDWTLSTTVDFHGENWPEPKDADKIMESFTHGVAVAISKAGEHYAISFPEGMQKPAAITPINPADARDMVAFPEDWEKYVYVMQGSP